ncbi:MAG TPA: IPT/TIG domain-containing protein [Kofleriaceae bacterium]|nr:IPT/TIG domain-containing protein [Kofleriaceae bacterium]
MSTILPDHGPPGAIVVIQGAYFCQRPDTGNDDPTCGTQGSVDFGEVPGTATVWDDNQIMVEVPAATVGSNDVVVIAAGRTSNAFPFTTD